MKGGDGVGKMAKAVSAPPTRPRVTDGSSAAAPEAAEVRASDAGKRKDNAGLD